MIYVKRVAIGNHENAFIESRFKKNINIIFSNENNKGKTLLLQSIYYTLGNIPNFPVSFNYKDYMFYLELEINGKLCYLLRKKDSIAIITERKDLIFEDINSFEKFFDENIYSLPRIIKDNKEVMVSLDLFIQNFFLGSDERSTSNIQHAGRFNKKDYTEMLYYLGTKKVIKNEDEENLNYELKDIKRKIKEINRTIKIKKEFDEINESFNPVLSKNKFDKFKSELENLTTNFQN